jgi:hypothetical protein
MIGIAQGDADAIERRRLENERRSTRRGVRAQLETAGRGSDNSGEGHLGNPVEGISGEN